MSVPGMGIYKDVHDSYTVYKPLPEPTYVKACTYVKKHVNDPAGQQELLEMLDLVKYSEDADRVLERLGDCHGGPV